MRNIVRRGSIDATFVVVLLMIVCSICGQNAAPASSTAQEQSPTQKYFTDTELTTQDGKQVRFYSDVLKDKVVVINCFFATCQGSCLPLNRTFEKTQTLLGDRLGKDVVLVSITVDPQMDTPARLKEYAAKFNARPGWFFLTGEKNNVDLIHKKLGQYVEDKQNHNNIFIIGNVRTGLWKKAFGLAKPEEIYQVVESVIADKETGGSQ
jgi:protein SCO1